jgi:hypothetical protein
MKPHAKPPARDPRAPRGGWSGGPIVDNPGARRFALWSALAVVLLYALAGIWLFLL